MSTPLDADQLRTFVAIAEAGGFTAAARATAKTQSAVSMQMKRLEERVGLKLFARDGRRNALTCEGSRLSRLRAAHHPAQRGGDHRPVLARAFGQYPARLAGRLRRAAAAADPSQLRALPPQGRDRRALHGLRAADREDRCGQGRPRHRDPRRHELHRRDLAPRGAAPGSAAATTTCSTKTRCLSPSAPSTCSWRRAAIAALDSVDRGPPHRLCELERDGPMQRRRGGVGDHGPARERASSRLAHPRRLPAAARLRDQPATRARCGRCRAGPDARQPRPAHPRPAGRPRPGTARTGAAPATRAAGERRRRPPGLRLFRCAARGGRVGRWAGGRRCALRAVGVA